MTGDAGSGRDVDPPQFAEDMRKEAAFKLDAAQDALEELERELVGIGHNRPPEPLDDIGMTAHDVSSARDDIRSLKEELTKSAPREDILEQTQDRVIAFGLKLATWLAERVTKFTDAVLVTLAPILVAKVTGVLPLIADAVGAVGKLLRHFSP